ncbi:class I adenylate-forming enzyme family protein [Mycobacterium sp.]|uniref:class I adenylate-forming enzyme family protein n=1 Tax=Mycobacterium sp. TaxID=1785 RepID=UPI003D13828A
MNAAPPAYWPADTSVPLCDDTVGTVLRHNAVQAPDRAAVIEWLAADGRYRFMSYSELARAAGAGAAILLAVAEPGERVAVWSPNSTEWVVVEYAAALAGLVLVPLNPSLTDAEVCDLLSRSGCVAILSVAEFRGQRLLDRAAALAIPQLRRIFDLAAWRAGDIPARGLPHVSPEAAFLVQYTSGTTGAPKGAVLSHRVAMNVGTLSVPLLGLPEGAIWCHPLPLHHVGGSVCVLLTVLAQTGTIVLMPGFEAAAVLDALVATRATAVGVVPTVLLALLEHADAADTDLSALQLMTIGGAAVAPSLIRRAERTFGARVVNTYGQSEAPWIAQTRLDDPDEVKALTIGRAGLHREVRIVASGTAETVGCGVVGELAVRSPVMMTGYLDDPEQTAAAFDGDGFLHTGDLCSMADGVISFHGRCREVIIRGGENVYPTEVEKVLVSHPAVGDAAVLGVPDERWGEQVAAAVRFRDQDPPNWGELEAWARESLAGYKVPRVWRAVEEFPTTASGKVQKYILREAFR